MSPKIILVFGATGIQGKGFIQALSAYNATSDQYTIYALTRSPASPSSTYLASLPGVKTIQVGPDVMDNPAQVFADLEKEGVKRWDVYGVFSVQGYVDDAVMYKQGTAIADAAVEFGVKHFVYSSCDFGDLGDCGVAGFEIKRKVENHIRTLPFGYTFIRPTQFMDVWSPSTPLQFRIGRTAYSKFALGPNPAKRHGLVSGLDVGRAAAEAIVRGPEWRVLAGGKDEKGVVRVCGDALAITEIERIYREEMGTELPYSYTLLARFVKTVVPIVGQMTTFFGQHGYNVNIEEVKAEMPWITDYRTFLRSQGPGTSA